MTVWMWLVAAGGVLLVALVGLTWTYGARLDRLHRRIASARLSLDRHLVKRSAEAVRLAASGALHGDDAAGLHKAATDALAAAEYPLAGDSLGGFARQGRGSTEESNTRLLRESRLSQVLRTTLTPEVRQRLVESPLTKTQLDLLDNATYRARVARTLHNQDVSSVQRLRAKPIVRVLHLSGHAPMPEFVDLDDQ